MEVPGWPPRAERVRGMAGTVGSAGAPVMTRGWCFGVVWVAAALGAATAGRIRPAAKTAAQA